MKRSIVLELETDERNPRLHRLSMVVGGETKLLGTIIDRDGWAVGTMDGESETDAPKVEDVVTSMLTVEADTISHMLVEWGDSETGDRQSRPPEPKARPSQSAKPTTQGGAKC